MSKTEKFIPGQIDFWRFNRENRGFYTIPEHHIKGEEFWRSQGYIPILADDNTVNWADPLELWKPDEAFRRFGNDINPLMAIFTEARNSVIRAIERYVSNTENHKLKLGFEITTHGDMGLVHRHFTSLYQGVNTCCFVEYEDSEAIPDYLADDPDEDADEYSELIDDLSLDELYEIIHFITEQNNENKREYQQSGSSNHYNTQS